MRNVIFRVSLESLLEYYYEGNYFHYKAHSYGHENWQQSTALVSTRGGGGGGGGGTIASQWASPGSPPFV